MSTAIVGQSNMIDWTLSPTPSARMAAVGLHGFQRLLKDLRRRRSFNPADGSAVGTEKTPAIFLHIPKTAGTSLRQIIEREYPGGRCVFIYTHTPEFLAAVRGKLPHARAVYGHLSFGIHEILGIEAHYVTFLRHPVRRVLSFYNHQVRKEDGEFHSQVKAGMTLIEMLESGICHQVNNHMVRIISGHQGSEPVWDTAVLERAAENIARYFVFVGIAEHMAASVKRLGRKLGFQRRYRIPRRNVNLNPILRMIDKRTRDAIEQYNRLDLMLYEQVHRSFRADKASGAT